MVLSCLRSLQLAAPLQLLTLKVLLQARHLPSPF